MNNENPKLNSNNGKKRVEKGVVGMSGDGAT